MPNKTIGKAAPSPSNRQVAPPTPQRMRSRRREKVTVLQDEEDAGITVATVDEGEEQPQQRPKPKKKKPAELSMERFVTALGQKKIEGLKAEFRLIQAYQPPDNATTAFTAAGNLKNRYENIVCYDRTRVVLTHEVPPETDYIHANWVSTSFVKLTNRYICTQAPLDETINDFWRMIWQEKVRHIAMLCNVMENGKPKCSQYYPLNTDETKMYGSITVTNKRNTTTKNEKIFESTLFEVTVEGQEPLQLILLRWLDWPDFGIPNSGMGMLRIMRIINNAKESTALIHCSAGVGRTGTLMACELCLRTMLSGKELNVPEIVKELRSQRAGAIQTEAQYIYLHRALSEYVHAKKIGRDEVAKFFSAFAEYRRSLKPPGT